ncbi:MAG: sigma-70 family RNA polymerase sigma factor [Capsulimonadales bacterium]|nr:sigma-70 family RNA polymerase sigma factor [Capsulimonadales bacterium]
MKTTEETASPSDAGLIRRSLRGERSAFAQIVARYREAVTATAFYALGNSEDAQDATQETFVYAFRNLNELRDVDRLLPWLRRIAVHRAIDLRRRRSTRSHSSLPDRYAETAKSVDTALPTLERSVMEMAIQQLSDPLRRTFELFYRQGHSLEEVAVLLDIPLNTVRSRLQAARQRLYHLLSGAFPERIETHFMAAKTVTENTTTTLPTEYEALLRSVFPDAAITDIKRDPEMWMPFEYRVTLRLPNGFERPVDFRGFANLLNEFRGSGEDPIALLDALKRCGLPVPERLAGPILRPDGSRVALCSTPIGENLLLRAFDGNPHRIRHATDLGIAAIDQLHGITARLEKEPIAARLPRRTLVDDLNEIIDKGGPWLSEPTFADALNRFRPIVEEVARTTPLVYTNDLYFPNFLRVQDDRITEFIQPFGWFGDPLLGLAKFRTYDCYPFVHTGFVERYLFDKGYSRRDFAPRLAVRALWTLQRETQAEQRPGENGYRDELLRQLRYALDSL